MLAATNAEVLFYSFDNPAADLQRLTPHTLRHTGWDIRIGRDEEHPWARVTLPQDDLMVNVSHLIGLLALAHDAAPKTVLGWLETQVNDLGYELRRKPRRWR